mgnify:CR=1 FL=1
MNRYIIKTVTTVTVEWEVFATSEDEAQELWESNPDDYDTITDTRDDYSPEYDYDDMTVREANHTKGFWAKIQRHGEAKWTYQMVYFADYYGNPVGGFSAPLCERADYEACLADPKRVPTIIGDYDFVGWYNGDGAAKSAVYAN